MVNKNPRGLRVNMPSGYVIGRASKGSGRAELIPVPGLKSGGGGSGASGRSGSLPTATNAEQLTGTSDTVLSTPDSVAALWEKGSDVASATTISFGDGGFFHVTGTTTITDIDFTTDKAGRWACVKFTGILVLTHSSTLILPNNGSNITTAAGDRATFVSEGSDVVICTSYQRADGTALQASGSGPGSGDFVGPGSSVGGDFVMFVGGTGKLGGDTGLSPSTDGTLAGNSDSLIPTQKAVKTYVDAQVAGAGSSISPFYDTVTKPVAANFTVATSNNTNHGTFTLTNLNSRGVVMDNVMANTGVITNGIAYKAAVSNTLVQVSAMVHRVWDITTGWFDGVFVRDNAGKIHAWGYRDSQFSEFFLSDLNTFNSQNNYGSINTSFYRIPTWYRIVKNGSNFELSYSLNGENWKLVATVSATSYIGATINDVGIITVNNNGSTTNHMTVACYSFAHS